MSKEKRTKVVSQSKAPTSLETMRHSLAHVLAQAVLQVYPSAKLAIGPVIEDGFYYDFDLGGEKFTQADLLKLEKRMHKIIEQNQKFERYERPIDESIEYLRQKAQPYKLELAQDLKVAGETKVSFYHNVDPQGKKRFFNDLCKGPHVASTKELGSAFKLTKIAGAYWRGDELRPMLQRIYGVAFATPSELEAYLERLKQAELRDHRKLGRELDLFVFSELVGPGLPLYTPRGALVRRLIVEYTDELQRGIGYLTVHTPNLNKAELFKVSGHYEKFKDGMFRVVSHYTNEEYFLKPMNCPQHTQLYAAKLRSYKDLPIRFADFANLYRDEKPGELAGLTRLRAFSQDDAHCFCREDQIEAEFVAVLGIIRTALATYGLEYSVRLSLRDVAHTEQYIGTDETWRKSQAILEAILKGQGIAYTRADGEAAFYGPKMDIMANDAIGREWQISTIQLDFGMPMRFGLTYVDADGKAKTPVMIHRAIIGSPERFMAILIEHYAGAFPVWLAPVQVQLIAVSEKFADAARATLDRLLASGVRAEMGDAGQTVGSQIRMAEVAKVPYMVVIGEQEAASGTLAVRRRGSKELEHLKVDALVELVVRQTKERK